MSLIRSNESTHDKMINLSPILTRTSGKMSDDINFRSFIQSWLMTKWTLRDHNDTFFTLIISIRPSIAITASTGFRISRR